MQRREKGSGSVYFSEKRKRWIGEIIVGIMPNGKSKKKSVSGKTKKEVKDKLTQIKAELVTGTYKDESSVTIVDIAKAINNNKRALNIIGEAAYNREMNNINIIDRSALSQIPIQQINEFILNDFFASITGYSDSIIEKVYSSVNRSLKRAIKMGIININPLEDVQKPKSEKGTKKVRALTEGEQRQVITALKAESKTQAVMLLLSIYTGMRIGEICALSNSDINFDFKTINVNKTITRNIQDKYVIGKTTKTYAGNRIIKMSDTVYNLLKSYEPIENDLNVFFYDSRKNTIFNTSQINCYFKRIITRYEISETTEGFTQHMLRHTFATRCIESGMPPKVLQHILGHTDIRITLNTYCDVFDSYESTYILQSEEYLKKKGLA